MYRWVLIGASFVLFSGVSYAAVDPSSISCLEADRGYNLIKSDGSIDVVRLYSHAVKKFGDSNLNKQTTAQLRQFGVTTGDPREWARLFVMVCKQESNCRIARTYPDGTLEKFPSTLQSERSYGPLQFNIGEYGLTSWAMVNSPSCTLEAFIRVAQQGKLFAYFGSMQRPNEVLRHANWFNTTVQPFVDALSLVYDPNAPDMRAYQAVAPYFVDPRTGTLLGSGYSNPYGQAYNLGAYSPTNGLLSGTTGSSFALGGGMTGYVAQPNVAQQPSTQQPATQSENVTATRSALRLLAQPLSVAAGGKTLLAWTSVGMQSGSCRVRAGSSQVANSNEGSRASERLFADTTFVLECKDPTGATVASEATVQVE